jgi:hypothetical protein
MQAPFPEQKRIPLARHVSKIGTPFISTFEDKMQASRDKAIVACYSTIASMRVTVPGLDSVLLFSMLSDRGGNLLCGDPTASSFQKGNLGWPYRGNSLSGATAETHVLLTLQLEHFYQ